MAKPKLVWNSTKTAAENARSVLLVLAENFFSAGREVADSKAAPKSLHQFRLEAKRFRYSLELFRPCYGPGLKQRLDSLKRVQDYLGAINDCETTIAMLQDPAFRKRPEKELLKVFLTNLAAKNKEDFARHWHDSFDAPGQLDQWTSYLRRFAGTRKKRE